MEVGEEGDSSFVVFWTPSLTRLFHTALCAAFSF